MPPDPLPWGDRKDFFKERKHERSDASSASSLGFAPRWRDSGSSSRDYSRWAGGGSSDFRRFPGHGKQGGWHTFSEESGHGYGLPFRLSDKMLEDESCRPAVSRGDGKYGRNSRDNRSSFSQRGDGRGHSWEMSNGSSNGPGRLHDVNNDQRSVDEMLTYSSHLPHSDFVSPWDQIHSKDQCDHNKMGGSNGLVTGHRGDRENSLDWKLKWSRFGSSSSRGSGFSHSSSSKSLGGADSDDGKVELQPKATNPVQFPSGDAAASATSTAPSEEMVSRKKPRLKWGEGLAKYEKKKVEGPNTCVNKDGGVMPATSAEPIHSQSPNLADKSPRVMGSSDCASPATPSSVACSSSSGIEEKTFGKAVNVDNDASNLCASPSVGSQSHPEGFIFNLEKLDGSLIANLGSSLIELLQCDDQNSVDPSFARSTAMNKLLIWKGDISKALEMTEAEIDLLENELKSLKHENVGGNTYMAASSSVHAEDNTEPYNEQGITSNDITQPLCLQIASSGDENLEKIPLEEIHLDVKIEEIDSPGTATSKFVEPDSFLKLASSSEMVKVNECFNHLDGNQSIVRCSVTCINQEGISVSACKDVNTLIACSNGESLSWDVNLPTNREDNLCTLILASNKDYAVRASEVFDKLLPIYQHKIDFSAVIDSVSRRNDALVKEKLCKRKRFLRLKERLVSIKFKAIQHLWKEDMQLSSLKKCRTKSQKKFEINLRTTHSGYPKNRSSIRSRFSASGYLSSVTKDEMHSSICRLLSDSQKIYRNSLKMPAQIMDKKEKMVSRFISSNGLVEDPCAVEKERAMINPWTLEEKEIFMDKLAVFGKDFRKISSFLVHKTTADCVEFYYKNHKSDSFEKIKRSKQVKSSTNYLISSSKKWNRELNAASLDILGAASVMASDADKSMLRQQMCSGRMYVGGYNNCKTLLSEDGVLKGTSNLDCIGNERETVAADVLAGICGSVSSDAMSSSITTSFDPGECCRQQKCQKVESAVKRLSASDVTQNVEDDTCSDDSCGEMDPVDWTDEEKSVFIQAVSSYGKDFAMISRCVRTRSRDQCKVFFSKARKCLGLDLIHPGPRNTGTPMSDDANGGGSDTEDACMLEIGSVICSDKLGSNGDGLPFSVKQDESGVAEAIDMDTDLNRTNDSELMVTKQKDPKVETLVSVACQMDERPETSVVDVKIMSGVECQSEPLKAGKMSVEPMLIGAADDSGPLMQNSVVEEMEGEVSASKMEPDSDGQECLLPQNQASCQSGLIQDLNATRNPHMPADADVLPNSGNGVENEQQASVKLESVENPPASVSVEGNNPIADSEGLASIAINSEKIHNQDMSLMHDLQENRDTEGKKSSCRDDYFCHLTGNSMLNHSEFPQVLRGYPLQIPTKMEMNGDIACRPLSDVQSLLNLERKITSQHGDQNIYIQKCNSSKTQCSVPEIPLLSQHTDQASDHSRSLSDNEKPCRSGDVKLFGKILSHPSSLQKPSSGKQEDNGKGAHNPKLCSKSSMLKFTGHHNTDENRIEAGFIGLDNVPTRSYGFWDGNRIQTGFSSLADSAIILAKYPDAFSNYHMSSSKMEHQALPAVVKSNDRSFNGVSVFSPREISGSNGVMDYQMYRSQDSTKVQPFMVEMKQQQDMFSELHRRNGFESISSAQQQGRGMLGMNVGGRGGILVGGPCSVISDPVVAIKMQYAKADQFGGQNGSIVREEPWRGKGDVGR